MADNKTTQPNQTNPLEKDLAAYEAKKAELQSHIGKFVVFFDGKQVGIYDNSQEAYVRGYEKAGVKPFLVMQISPVPNIQHFSRAIRFGCLTSS